MIKRIRKSEDFPAFRYFAVWEYGHKHHRPHFHYLIFVRKEEGDSPAFPLMLEQRWEEIFKDAMLTGAMVDRLAYKAHILDLSRDVSHRYEETVKWQKEKN